jgi:hypothetical protein
LFANTFNHIKSFQLLTYNILEPLPNLEALENENSCFEGEQLVGAKQML